MAYDTVGVRDIIRTGENGVLVPLRDRQSFREEITRLIYDDNLRTKLGKNARIESIRHYSYTHTTQPFLDLYGE